MRKLLALGALLSLVGVWIATRPSPAAPPEGKGDTSDRPRYVIRPGVGIEGLEIGMTRKEVAEFLKVKDNGKDDAFTQVPYRGLDVKFAEGRVSEVTFTYQDQINDQGENAWPFDGLTDKGIGRLSTVHDVIRKYGEPDWAKKNKNGNTYSWRKPYPNLEYPDLGIAFCFRGDTGNLWYIRVKTPEKKEK
jgi:hypothetical protein